MKRLHLIISGRVQGVFFRYNARRQARKFHLTGWVRNNLNATVEILAEGEKKDLDSFLAWCKKGPITAKVEKVDIKWESSKGNLQRFTVEKYK